VVRGPEAAENAELQFAIKVNLLWRRALVPAGWLAPYIVIAPQPKPHIPIPIPKTICRHMWPSLCAVSGWKPFGQGKQTLEFIKSNSCRAAPPTSSGLARAQKKKGRKIIAYKTHLATASAAHSTFGPGQKHTYTPDSDIADTRFACIIFTHTPPHPRTYLPLHNPTLLLAFGKTNKTPVAQKRSSPPSALTKSWLLWYSPIIMVYIF